MGQPARLEKEEQKTFRKTIQLLQWPEIVLARAVVGAFPSLVYNKLVRSIPINDCITCKRIFAVFWAPILIFLVKHNNDKPN